MEKTIYLVGVLVAIVGVIIAICTLRKQTKVSQWTFFSEYTRRYQKIVLHLPGNLNDITVLKNIDTKRYLRVYFDLCDEQYFLHKKGRLNKTIWKEWKEGMESMFETKVVSTYWEKRKRSDSDFCDFVEKEIIGK